MVPLGLPSARPMAQVLRLPFEYYIYITCICVQWVAMVFLVYREGMQLPLVAMVLREASALMRISSYYYYLCVQWVAMVFLVYREGLACSCL